MVGMSAGMEMETGAAGGLLKSLGRKMFGGESFFLNTYTGVQNGDSVALAPPLPGDISVIEMHGETLMVQSGAYLASSAGINVENKWGGAKTFFGSEGLIMLRISGTGTLIVSSYGAIHDVVLAEGQKYVVDTGHLVTFEEHLKFDLKKGGGVEEYPVQRRGLGGRADRPRNSDPAEPQPGFVPVVADPATPEADDLCELGQLVQLACPRLV